MQRFSLLCNLTATQRGAALCSSSRSQTNHIAPLLVWNKGWLETGFCCVKIQSFENQASICALPYKLQCERFLGEKGRSQKCSFGGAKIGMIFPLRLSQNQVWTGNLNDLQQFLPPRWCGTQAGAPTDWASCKKPLGGLTKSIWPWFKRQFFQCFIRRFLSNTGNSSKK